MLDEQGFQEQVTSEELALLRDCLLGGLADYHDPELYSARARRDHDKRTRAQIRSAHINARLQRAVPEQPRLRYTPRKGRPLYAIGDVLISPKKLDNHLRPRIGKTRQARAFAAQLPLAIETVESTHIVLGYAFDPFEVIPAAYIMCPGVNRNHWTAELKRSEPTPLQADVVVREEPAPAKRRVVVRPTEQGSEVLRGAKEEA